MISLPTTTCASLVASCPAALRRPGSTATPRSVITHFHSFPSSDYTSQDLNDRFKEREKACAKLETAVSTLLRQATVAWHTRQRSHKKEVKALESARKKELKLAEKQKKKGRMLDIDPERVVTGPEPLGIDPAPLTAEKATPEFLAELVPDAQRPKHKLGWLRFVGLGQKVDTIDYCKVGAR